MAKSKTSLWRNPAIVGPVVAAAIAAIVAMVMGLGGYIFPDRDHEPPKKPTILNVTRVSAEDGSDAVVVKYERAEDNEGGSGLREVRLWFRYLQSGEWTETSLAKTGASGEIRFTDFQESGRYWFDVVSVDQQGNRSATPRGTDGQRDYYFLTRADVLKLSDGESTELQNALKEFREKHPDSAQKRGWIRIPVHFHIIHDGEEGNVDDDDIHRQIAVLNRSFFDGKIAFILQSIDRTNNTNWLHFGQRGRTEREIKSRLMRSPSEGLNVYTASPLGHVMGWAACPWELADDPVLDGVVLRFDCLPGGEGVPFNLGDVLVQQVGRWLGLYYTFQGGCDGEGDHVEDTVAHSGPNFGKPEVGLRHNACNPNEAAPVKNFMNYLDDEWMDHFTPGQFRRMREMIGKYRPKLID